MMGQQKDSHSYKGGGRCFSAPARPRTKVLIPQLLRGGYNTGICLSLRDAVLTKAVALLCEPHASKGGSEVGTKASPPSPGWEHSSGLLQLQKLPAGLPGASITIGLGFSFLLCPPLLFGTTHRCCSGECAPKTLLQGTLHLYFRMAGIRK